jgi:hypothetical protein
MKVRFHQSGGLVGTVHGCEVDTKTLAPEAAKEFERLVHGSGIAASGASLSDTGRDLRQYEITIEDGKRKVSVVFDDQTIPAAAKPLLGLLKKHARPETLG